MFSRGASSKQLGGGGHTGKTAPGGGLTGVVSPLVSAVRACLDTNFSRKAVNAFFNVVFSPGISAKEMLDTGGASVCVKLLTLPDANHVAMALGVLHWMTSQSRENKTMIFYLPGFRQAYMPMVVDCVAEALDMMWGLSDVVELSDDIVNHDGFLPSMLNDIEANYERWGTEGEMQTLAIVRNLTMYPNCVPVILAQPNAVDVLLGVVRGKNARAKPRAMMAIANLVGKDEKKSGLLRSDHSTLTVVVDILADIVTKRDDAERRWTFALYEPLLSLKYLSIPEKNREILRAKLLPLLPLALNSALSTNDFVSCGHVVGILSQFAFDEASFETLASNTKMIADLEAIVTKGETSPQTWREAARETQGLLWSLRGGGGALEVPPESVAVTKSSSPLVISQIMISYNWSHKTVAMRLASVLRSRGFAVWQDVTNLSHDIMESMAIGVQTSQCVIILVSPQYKESANCQREASLAAKRGKKIVPLLVERTKGGEAYGGEGWLELFIAPLLYYDVTLDFEGQIEDMIAKELLPNASSHNDRTDKGNYYPFHQKSIGAKIESVEDVVKWAKDNGLGEELAEALRREEMDGQALRQLHLEWVKTGRISASEVKALLGIRTLGLLFKLRSGLEGF